MKMILITGAGKGIGLAIAQELHHSKHRLILLTKTKLSYDRLSRTFPRTDVYQVDLADQRALRRFVMLFKSKYPRLDVLVNNAGIYIGKKIEDTSAQELDALYRLCLRAPFVLIKELLELLYKTPHPQIINISSAANFARIPTEGAYTAIKAALTAFGDVLQKELQRTGVRVTTIHPWSVNTHNFKKGKKMLQPQDVSRLIAYIIDTNPHCEILNIELSGLYDWRGDWAPWTRH